MYVMTNSVRIFSGELTDWIIVEARFNQSKCQMYIYYKYAAYVFKLVVLSHVHDCVYWYTYEELGKWFLDTLGNALHLNFLVYSHWFMSIMI